jgi:thioredoxin-related protein
MGYPTTVLFSSIDAQPAPIPGYMKPADLEAPLKYFGDGNYKKENFPVFMNKFTASW